MAMQVTWQKSANRQRKQVLVYYIDEPRQRLYITTLWDVRRAPATLIVSK